MAYSRMKTCKHCGIEFDLDSPEKRAAEGYANECADCVWERGGDDSPPRYLAVQGGDGKMANITILAFENNEDRDRYQSAWRSNTGFHKGKSCHLSGSNTHMGGLKFRKVGENRGNSNHKGRL